MVDRFFLSAIIGTFDRRNVSISKRKKNLTLITFHDVTLQLRDRRILEHVVWSIRGNEHWAIVGANGSGKSVLARALYGTVPVVDGEIIYDFFKKARFKKGAGGQFSPEDFIAHVSFEDQRNLIAGESTYYQSRWNSAEGEGALMVSDVLPNITKAARNSRQMRIIQDLGLNNLLNKKLVHLSHGEMRKTLIAEALLESPLILILDDPFVGLDYLSRRALRGIVNKLMKGGMRIIFATSRVDEIPSGITHVAWLDNGRIAYAGRRGEVLEKMDLKGPSSGARRLPPVPQTNRKKKVIVAARRPALIEIQNASVAYDEVEVLKDINWTMREGENWAILGPNGSGKTTLLSLIFADHPQAYSNEICLFGRRRGTGESIWEIKGNIGWVSPEIQIHYQKQMTAHDVICSGFFDSIGLYRQCSARQKNIASAWMKSLGISDLAEVRFDELSAGQQKLTLIARASVKNPKLLILDEPCQGLDINNRRIVLNAIDAIGRRGLSHLIYVTHRLEEFPNSISHVLRLRNGHAARQGKRKNVLR